MKPDTEYSAGVVAYTNRSLCLVEILIIFVLAVSLTIAQDRQSQQNLHPGIPYSISDIENINLTNGNLMFDFVFGAVKGRGTANTGISLKYNSKLYESHVMTTLDTQGNPFPQQFLRADYEGGWKYDGDYELRVINRNSFVDNPAQPGGGCDVPSHDAVYVWKLIMHFPDGSQHEFRPTGYSDNGYNSSGYSVYDGDGHFNIDTRGVRSELSWTSLPNPNCPGGTSYSVIVTSYQEPHSKMVYYSSDGTYMRLEIPAGQNVNPSQWTLYMPDGSRVTNGELDAQNNPLSQRIYDKNGNFVTKGSVILPDGSAASGYVDQFGRYVVKKEVSSLEDHIIRLGVNGEQIVWKVRWKYITVIRKYTTSGTSGGIGRCCYSDQILVSQPKVVDEIELPSQMGGLKYTFEYDGHEGQVSWNGSVTNPNSSPGWGDLRQVVLPSAARAEYSYATDGVVPWTFADQWLPQLGKISGKSLTYNEEYDGQIQQITNNWSYSINPSGTAVLTGPDGGVATQYFYNTTTDNDLSGRVFKEISPNGTITERIWANNKVGGCPQYGCGSMRRLNTYIKTEFVTIPDSSGNPSLTTIKDFEYDKNGNVTKVTEYDWISYGSIPRDTYGNPGIPGNILPARVTENVFYNQTETATNSTANNTASYWNITAPNVRNAVRSTEIKNSAGAPVSRAEFEYDNYSTTANLLTTKSWDSFKGGTARAYSNPLTSTNSITTSATYNPYGMPLTTTDGNNVTTQITYGDVIGPNGAVTDLYPTQVVTAYGTSVARTSAAVYDFYTGLVTTATDVDNNVSAVTEYDDLGRPTKVRTAAGTLLESWTRTEYDDVNRRVIVRADLAAVGDGKKVAIQHYDQLGRVRLSRTLENAATEDPYNETHGMKVETRFKTVSGYTYQLTSNPYRANYSTNETDPTMGWTLSTAWTDGKRSEVQTFAGAGLPTVFGGNNTNSTGIVRTDIDANATTVTDQAGKLRRSITNGLGQLIRIDEPNSSNQLGTVASPNQKTDYTYDVLNNLLTVTQSGSGTTQCGPSGGTCTQTRTFTYSSLSRLLSANNPESGTINYSYDPNGNLTSKTDARSITTTYTYDPLNRVTNRAYTNEPSGSETPDVDYFYATTAPKVGKLVKVTNGTGTDHSTTEYTSFDILGRVTGHKQTTDGNEYTTGYTYYLSGAVNEQTYPSGRVVKNTLDADGGLGLVQSKKTSSDFYRPYASNFLYNAAGAVTAMRLGNGRWENTEFNSRLQPTKIGLGSGVSSQSLLKLEYSYGTTANNGNVVEQKITVPGVAHPYIQAYTYDELNRLATAEETKNSSQEWKQTFVYDRYGNRNFATTSGATTTLPSGFDPDIYNPTVSTSNNRFSSGQGYSYDSSGDTTADAEGRTFVYDAENKQIEVIESSTTIGQYFYDGDGKRIKKYVPGTGETTIFVYDAMGRLIQEHSTVVQTGSNAKTVYTTNDHLGSPRINTDATGQVISRHDYHPFGEEVTRSGYGSDTVRKQFTGYERDGETNLDFAQARMFKFSFGRFMIPDPFKIVAEVTKVPDVERAKRLLLNFLSEPQNWNQYVYVVNNPFRYTDPSGKLLEFTGSEAEQRAALARVFTVLGSERAKLVMLSKNSNGNYVLSIGEDNLKKFAAIGGNKDEQALSHGMGALLASPKTVRFMIAETYEAKSRPDQPFRQYSTANASGGTTLEAWQTKSGFVEIFVHPNSGDVASQTPVVDGIYAPSGQILFTNDMGDAHELGHASDLISPSWKVKRDPFRQETWIDDYSVAFENAVRSRYESNIRRTHESPVRF